MLPSIFISCLVMLYAAYLEWNSFRNPPFKDYKSIIISIGILGTFIGILYGLWNFNTDDITASVPLLLKGLKLAFITSIFGMFISIVLSFIENNNIALSKDDDSNENLNLKVLKSILKEQEATNKKSNLIYNSIMKSDETTNKHFNMVNETLKKTLDTLSKGATKEIITALKTVISDFNNNLQEQFGDNFKQLNESVKRMIVWQENYKVAIEQIERNLQIAVTNIEKTSEYIQTFTNNYEKISDISKELGQVIEVNQNQINNLETHMNNLKKIGSEASLITATINDFSKTIQGSLSNQSEGLNKLNDNLVKQLDSSLGNLNTALTSLTGKFREDYEHFLNLIKPLLPK